MLVKSFACSFQVIASDNRDSCGFGDVFLTLQIKSYAVLFVCVDAESNGMTLMSVWFRHILVDIAIKRCKKVKFSIALKLGYAFQLVKPYMNQT